MPYCSRITRYDIQDVSGHWKVSYQTPFPPTMVSFGRIMDLTFRGTRATGPKRQLKGFEREWTADVMIPKTVISLPSLRSFMEILQWTVTIADDADESHAVYLHNLPFPRKGDEDPDAVDFHHTRVGDLVKRAKSYSHNTGDAVAATELTDTVMRYWMERHPRYMRADIMIPAAPGNPHKRFDLPLFMATRLASNLGKELVKCSKP